MKKAFISVAGLAMATLILASCSSNSVKAPKKGKAVDEIKLISKTGSTIEFKQSDELKDVVDKIFTESNGIGLDYDDSNYNYKDSTGFRSVGYKTVRKVTDKYKEENGYNKSESYLFGKRSVSAKRTTASDAYKSLDQKSDVEFSQKCYESNSNKITTNETIDKLKYSSKRNGESAVAAEKSFDSSYMNIEAATYGKGSTKASQGANHQSEKLSSKSNEYTYVTDKVSVNDENKLYGTYYGYKGEREYSYNYNFTYPFDVHVDSLYVLNEDDIYEDYVKDLYESATFELTDKEIIIKTKSINLPIIHDRVWEKYDYSDVSTTEKFVEAMKKVAADEFKGSYYEKEIWISYESENFAEKGFTYSYEKSVNYANFKIEYEWTKDKLEDLGIYNEINKPFVGKKYRKEGTSKEEYTIAANSSSYDKKIERLYKKAKKNNAYDGIYFTLFY